MKVPASERGAALLAVLAMVVLLTGFATLGLERLKAAGSRISDSQALSEAQLLASTATATATSLTPVLKARLRLQPTLLDDPLVLPSEAGTVTLRFAEGGNCFNLNALAAPPQSNPAMGQPQPAARPQDLARLLAAVGVPLLEANTVAQATAARLAQTGQLWADASEWRVVPSTTVFCASVICTSPVPGGRSTISTSSAPHCTCISICCSAPISIGPRQTTAWPSLVISPIDIIVTP